MTRRMPASGGDLGQTRGAAATHMKKSLPAQARPLALLAEINYTLAVARNVTEPGDQDRWQRPRARLRDIFYRFWSQPVSQVVQRINPILRGWVTYFAIGHSSRSFSYVCSWVDMKIQRHWLRARQRPGFGWRRWRWLRLSRAVGVFLDYRDYRVRPYRPAAACACEGS